MTFERVYAALEKVFGAKQRRKPKTEAHTKAEALLKPRPLTMCPGCPHRATHMALMKALKKLKIKNPIIFGDIGCYELGHEPPFDDMDSIYNMGAGVGLANGVAHAGVESPVLALIGDSTLLHAGLPAFANAVHNHADMTMIVFDNSTIAMTGHQASINSHRTLMGGETQGADLAGLLKATGASYVAVTDAFNIKQTQKAIQEAVQTPSASAVVAQGPCALEYDRVKRKEGIAIETYEVDPDRCIGCRLCTEQFACPALIWMPEEEKAAVDPFLCDGCGVCVQVCPNEAFVKKEDKP
jgi:indolepyruvate ferredoxin oxidoreductase alpha subunit